MIILSVDYGDTRTGIAVCDKTEFWRLRDRYNRKRIRAAD